jgi:hypothetical protein
MDERKELVMSWLEEEGERERQRRPVMVPLRFQDPVVRGWVHVGVCALVGALVLVIFLCWLADAWCLSGRVVGLEGVHQEQTYWSTR